jgi:UDP-glucuronate decarboxylase
MESNPVILNDINEIATSNLPWRKLEGKKLLVTGASGFLPAYLVKSVLCRNATQPDERKLIRVVAMVRNLEKGQDRFKDFLGQTEFELLQHDVNEPLELDTEIQFIIHAASQASPKFYSSDPVGTLKANTIGTINLLEFARLQPIESFLYFSSSEVYGQKDGVDYLSEEDYGVVNPMQVRSCYAESKRMGETICISYMHQYNVPVKIVRPFHTYGPGLALDDGRVFADFVGNIVRREDIVLNSPGLSSRSFCYIKDATLGFLYVLLQGEKMQAYNIANPAASINIKDLAHLLVKMFPERSLKVVMKTFNDKAYIPSSFDKLLPSVKKMEELGWYPVTGLEEGFKKTVQSFLI